MPTTVSGNSAISSPSWKRSPTRRPVARAASAPTSASKPAAPRGRHAGTGRRRGERPPAPRRRREVRPGRCQVTEALKRVAHRDRHSSVDTRVVGEMTKRPVRDVRRRRVHPEDDVEDELGRAALGADDEVVVVVPSRNPCRTPCVSATVATTRLTPRATDTTVKTVGQARPEVSQGDGEDGHAAAATRLTSAMSTTRSAALSAAGSCETTTSVFRPSRHTPRNSSRTARAVWTSRLAHGSSARISAGSFASARAMATRCCSPRESC